MSYGRSRNELTPVTVFLVPKPCPARENTSWAGNEGVVREQGPRNYR